MTVLPTAPPAGMQADVGDVWGAINAERRQDCPRYSEDSKAWKRRSSCHSCWAFWLDFRKVAHGEEGFSEPRESWEQAETVAVNLSGCAQRLGPGRKV